MCSFRGIDIGTLRPIVFFYLIIGFLIFRASLTISAGRDVVDSLMAELQRPYHDTVKFELLLEIGDHFYFNDPETALDYFIEARELAEMNLEMPDGPFERKFTQQKAKAIRYIAYVYTNWGDYVTALEMYFLALNIGYEIGCSLNIYNSYNNIAIINHKRKDFNVAREYYERALEITESAGNDVGSVKLYNNLGVLYYDLGNEAVDIPEREIHYDTALVMFTRTLRLRQELGDRWGQALCYNNLGNLTRDASRIAGDGAAVVRGIGRAEEYYRRALEIAIEVNDMLTESKAQGNLSELFLMRYDLEGLPAAERSALAGSAVHYADEAYRLAEELNSLDQQHVAAMLARNAYARTGNTAMALHYADRYIELSERVFSEEKTASLNDMRVRYESEKKENEISLLSQENELARIRIENARMGRIFLIVIALSFLLLSALLLRLYYNRKRTSRLLEEKNRELAELNSTKDKFISILAHDLKNPFSAFLNITSALERGFDSIDEEERKEWIEQLQQSALQLNNLLKNMLEWALLKHDTAKTGVETLDLASVAGEAVAALYCFIGEHRSEVVNEIPADTRVRANRTYLCSLINNLVTNAVKFSGNGHPVTIRASSNGNRVMVTVEDRGLGIAPEDVTKLFRIDVDARAIGNPEGKGTGMGLIICRELVERMDGEIWAESEPGRGSRFIFTLPSGEVSLS
ncbi:MAG: hypothetical protein EA408_08060 [Marinilabiliales bacterium]|nr:MAG: hypothetical protein EA408_08060 [Marinilabiliales bacterium]